MGFFAIFKIKKSKKPTMTIQEALSGVSRRACTIIEQPFLFTYMGDLMSMSTSNEKPVTE